MLTISRVMMRLSRRPRSWVPILTMVLAIGTVVYVLVLGETGAAGRSFPRTPRSVFGTAERGKPLAIIHVHGQTINFRGVECRLQDSEILDISLGQHIEDATYLHAVVFLGPRTPAGTYVGTYAPLLLGHQPGATFDMRTGTGQLELSPQLLSRLPQQASGSRVDFGSIMINGTDASGALISGAVDCGSQSDRPQAT